MLTLGVLLLLMTGVCWVGIAAVVRDSACHDLDIGRIQFYTSGALVLIASVGLLLHLPLSGSWQNRLLVSIPVFFAGVANFVMLSLMKSGMAYGNPGAVWGIVQSAFICPFLMGIICFGVAPAFSRITGILLIIAGIALFSRDQPQRKSRGCSWLLPTLVAFLVAGLGQCFGNLPSYMTSLDMPPVFRVILVQGGTVAAFAASFMFRNGVKTEKNLRPVWKPVVLLTMVQLISLFFCFYHGLDLTARAGAGSIGYPIAQGSCIVFFMFYEKIRYRKKHPLTSWAAVVVQCAGLTVIAL